jgi:acetylornithine deacetylase/succinyl-diaminopimelate desuccinylase-like protein
MDFQTIENEALDDLQRLIRCPSVNPGGDEREAADYVLARLREAGYEPDWLESEGRPNVVARLPGDGSLPGGALLLTAHLDVVPVEASRWTHPPFEAVIDGEYLYGRGAIDMKNMVAMCLAVMRHLKLSGARLGRDLIFAAIADEEQGCTHGSRFLVEQHPDKVRAECMLGEFGAFSVDVKGRRMYPIQVAEKGTCRLELIARGEPGHGSLPRPDTAVVQLAEAVARLGTARLPRHRVATVEEFLRATGAAQGFPASFALPKLYSGLGGVILDKLLPAANRPAFGAMLSNTVSPTLLSAGEAVNVIPGEARARLDGRLLPGQTAEDLVREVREVVGRELELVVLSSTPGRENPGPHPLLEHLMATVRAHDPSGVPVPYLLVGCTDAQWFGRLIPHCFGFSPVRFPVEDGINPPQLFHAHDERIHVPGFKWGLRVLWDAVAGYCRAGEA